MIITVYQKVTNQHCILRIRSSPCEILNLQFYNISVLARNYVENKKDL